MKTEEVLKLWRDVVVASIGSGNQPGESIAAANRVCDEMLQARDYQQEAVDVAWCDMVRRNIIHMKER